MDGYIYIYILCTLRHNSNWKIEFWCILRACEAKRVSPFQSLFTVGAVKAPPTPAETPVEVSLKHIDAKLNDDRLEWFDFGDSNIKQLCHSAPSNSIFFLFVCSIGTKSWSQVMKPKAKPPPPPRFESQRPQQLWICLKIEIQWDTLWESMRHCIIPCRVIQSFKPSNLSFHSRTKTSSELSDVSRHKTSARFDLGAAQEHERRTKGRVNSCTVVSPVSHHKSRSPGFSSAKSKYTGWGAITRAIPIYVNNVCNMCDISCIIHIPAVEM